MSNLITSYFTQQDPSVPVIEPRHPSIVDIQAFLNIGPKDLNSEKMAAESKFPSLHSLNAQQIFDEYTQKQQALEKLSSFINENFLSQTTDPTTLLETAKSMVEKWLSRSQALALYAAKRFSSEALKTDSKKVSRLLVSTSKQNQDNWARVSSQQFERIHENIIAPKISPEMQAKTKNLAKNTLQQIAHLAEKFKPDRSHNHKPRRL